MGKNILVVKDNEDIKELIGTLINEKAV